MSYDASVSELVTAALGGNEGVRADRPDLHGDLPGLPAALGRGVAKLHALDVAVGSVPVDLGSAIHARLEARAIDADALPEPYDRYQPERLVKIWTEAVLPESYDATPVVLAGALTIDRMLISDGELTGIDGPCGLIGDRHLDLAVLQHSLHHRLGPEAVFGFYEAYGADPNIVVLDHYVLAALLLGWIT